MQLNTESLKTVREADYDPETRMVKLTIVCRPDDLRISNGISDVEIDLVEVLTTTERIDQYEGGVAV